MHGVERSEVKKGTRVQKRKKKIDKKEAWLETCRVEQDAKKKKMSE